ncbi:MAG: site-2 protease family protein [Acidobacteria bacterium]|nr:site-2 protease family protein [Acidobacteriota bacterium]
MLDFQTAVLNVSLLWILTVPHEFAHAWVADKLGDDTPRLDGRVTLHPLAHVDWVGTVILPFVTSLFGAGFLGWGRAVQTNPGKLRGGLNGLAIVALAGPVSNVIFAVVLAAIAALLATRVPVAAEFAARGVVLSFYLAIFNLLPVPPLDGSKLLLAARIPMSIYNEIARAGFLVLLVLLTATGLGRWMSALSYGAAETVFSLLKV